MKKKPQIILVIIFLSLYLLGNQAFSQTEIFSNTSDTTIYSYEDVDSKPDFAGGDEARRDFLLKNLKYPQKARESGTLGKVYISFVLEKDGSISNLILLKGIGDGCDEEALRVIQLMPKWIPAKKNGEYVRVRFNLPLQYSF